jgi:hypothetical protein
MKGGGKMSGVKLDLDAAIVGVSDIGAGFKEIQGSGDPMRHAADTRLEAGLLQTRVNNLGGGGIASTSMVVDCPTVSGSTSQQQASSCALFKTTAETNIQTRLFNQLGGRRKQKRQRKLRTKRRRMKSRSNKKRSNKKRSNKSRSNKKRRKKKSTRKKQ